MVSSNTERPRREREGPGSILAETRFRSRRTSSERKKKNTSFFFIELIDQKKGGVSEKRNKSTSHGRWVFKNRLEYGPSFSLFSFLLFLLFSTQLRDVCGCVCSAAGLGEENEFRS